MVFHPRYVENGYFYVNYTDKNGDSVVARYGGDEFVALLPSTPKAAAIVYAERMRAIIERYPFPYGKLTASFGVAGLPDDTESVPELLKTADHALYEAKRQGRNLVGGRK